MKIAHLTDCYLPRLGGIEVQVHDVATRQLAAGHTVEVLTATQGETRVRGRSRDLVDGVPVHRLSMRVPFELPVNPWAAAAVRTVLAEGGFDVAHVHAGVISPFAVDAARVSVGLGVPTLVTWHCLLGGLEPVFRLLERGTGWARRPMALSAVSDVAAAPLRRIAGPGAEVAVLPNGIDVETWRVVPAARAEQTVHVVATMRLAPRKRPIPLLRILRDVRRLVPDDIRLRATIVGDGPALAPARRYVDRHGLGSWVRLLGRLRRSQIRELYRDADVFVAPAELESFGIAALEARCAGLPVVAKAVSGIREFVHDGQEGLLAGSDLEMADALVRLVTDAELRARIAAHNRAVEPDMSWPRVLKRTEEEYLRAIAIMAFHRDRGRA
ncbi:MAG TPA: glycosyltransferase family 4 protein [Actinomycetes bacterium]|nr:glycosyltransferase family 4 protein [Actinomycetes bacterium]